MKTIGLAVITFNEQKCIADVLKSAAFANQIVVVDSFSTDSTAQIVKSFDATFIQRKWTSYSEQKQFCLDQITTDWVLVLDGDECLSPELALEVQSILKQPSKYNAYKLKRHLIFLNRELKYGRGVDSQLRLFKNGVGKYTKRNIHEQIIVDCEVGELKNQILHYSSQNIQAELDKITRDTEMELANYNSEKIGFKEIFIQPLQFFIMLFIKGSWRDGIPGILFLTLTAFKYVVMRGKLYELSMKIESEK